MPQYPARPHKTLYKMNHFSLGRQTSSNGIKKPKGAAGNRQQNITVPPPMPRRGLESKRRKTKILPQPCNCRILETVPPGSGERKGSQYKQWFTGGGVQLPSYLFSSHS